MSKLKVECLRNRIFAEVEAELEDKIIEPELVRTAFHAKCQQLINAQLQRWLRQYDIESRDPGCWRQLVERLAWDQLVASVKPEKPIGPRKWTYPACKKLVETVEAHLANGGTLSKAFESVQRLPEYKSIDKIKPRYYEARKILRRCAIPILLEQDPDEYLKSNRRRTKRSTKFSV